MPLRDISGHTALLALLSRAVARASLPQSLLFAGPAGVGKRLTALAVAQLLNCVAPRPATGAGLELDACGVCAVCRRIVDLTFPDVLVVPPNPSIGEARAVMQSAGYRPFEGRRRVTILDDADEMSPAVQNAWLKTLEEPPSTSTFILVSARPELLLPTVRSRCPSLRFGRLPVDDVAAILTKRHGMDAIPARQAAFAADGSLGLALSAASEVGTATHALVERVVHEAADARTADQRLRMAARMLEPLEIKPARGRARTASRSAPERELLGERLQVLTTALRDLSVAACGGDARLMSQAPSADVLLLAKRWGTARLTLAFDAVASAQQALDRNASPKVVADWLAMHM